MEANVINDCQAFSAHKTDTGASHAHSVVAIVILKCLSQARARAREVSVSHGKTITRLQMFKHSLISY